MLPPYEVLLPLAPWECPQIVSESLASLKAQTLQPHRVVVSCDGQPPQALRNVLDDSGLPLMIVLGPGGEGVGPVLARGLQRCECDLIIRADADDVSMPDRCRQQMQAMIDRPRLTVLSGHVREFNSSPGSTVGVRRVPSGVRQIRRFSQWRNPINHPAVSLRRSAVLAVGNYRCCPGFEDYDLWLRLLKHGAEIDNLPCDLVWCRVGPRHLSRRRGWGYMIHEGRFFLRSAQEGSIRWPVALGLILMRCPIRLMPSRLQEICTRTITRRNPSTDASA
jgi:hypothetical protein